jgi:hypothetical protein
MLLMTSTPLLTRCPFSREIDTPCGRSHRRLAIESTSRDRSNYHLIHRICFSFLDRSNSQERIPLMYPGLELGLRFETMATISVSRLLSLPFN